MTVLDDPRPPCKWTLTAQEDGSVEVWQGRKRVSTNDDMESATRYVQDRLVPGDRVQTEDPDGYLRKTRLVRRRWRAD